MKPGRVPLLTIAFLVVLLQQGFPSIPPALALRGLDDVGQIQNGLSRSDSNATTDLPDPSNCNPLQSTQLGTFFFANSSEKEHHGRGADTVTQPPLASNSSERQNTTHNPCILNGIVSDCANASSTSAHLPEQINQAGDVKSYTVMHVDKGAVAHVAEDAPLYEIASMHVGVNGKDDVLLVNDEGSASTDPSSVVKDSVQVMVIHDDDVVLVEADQRNIATSRAPAAHIQAQSSIARDSGKGDVLWTTEERLAGSTAPPGDSSIHTAAQSSVASESVQVMELGKGDVLWMTEERLAGSTAPPGDSSIHTAAQSSVARESVQVMELGKGDVLWMTEERLVGSTAPPGDSSIHTAAQSSVARESVQVMVIDEDDVVLTNSEQLGRATPPPIDTSIHTAGQRSAARESIQVMEMSEDGVYKERFSTSTPPPGDSDIHTASQSSVARESSFHASFQHDESQHDHVMML